MKASCEQDASVVWARLRRGAGDECGRSMSELGVTNAQGVDGLRGRHGRDENGIYARYGDIPCRASVDKA